MHLRLEVFDPALCCPTGVCGPSVDPALARFAGDLARLRREGVTIERHNLSHDPGAFAGNDLVRGEIEKRGVACLPVIVANGRMVSVARYPDRAELHASARSRRRGADAGGRPGPLLRRRVLRPDRRLRWVAAPRPRASRRCGEEPRERSSSRARAASARRRSPAPPRWALAESGTQVLLVSTDPASNLDEVLGVALGPAAHARAGRPRALRARTSTRVAAARGLPRARRRP